jgi:hypothetical protein
VVVVVTAAVLVTTSFLPFYRLFFTTFVLSILLFLFLLSRFVLLFIFLCVFRINTGENDVLLLTK